MLGVGLGALLMFYLDPSRGRRRRALVRDKVIRAGHSAGEMIEGTRRDLGNRLQGVKARVQRLGHTEPVDDAVLTERVRAQLGRYTTHARDLDIAVCDGEVTLRGAVGSGETKPLLRAVKRVPGVCNVIDLTEVDLNAPVSARAMSVPMMLLVATGAAGAAVAARAAVNRNAAQ